MSIIPILHHNPSYRGKDIKSPLYIVHDLLSTLLCLSLIIYIFVVWERIPDEVITNFLPEGEMNYGSKWNLFIWIGLAVIVTILNPILRVYAHHFAFFDVDVSTSKASLRKVKTFFSWVMFGTVIFFTGYSVERIQASFQFEFSLFPFHLIYPGILILGVLISFFVMGIQRLNEYNR